MAKATRSARELPKLSSSNVHCRTGPTCSRQTTPTTPSPIRMDASSMDVIPRGANSSRKACRARVNLRVMCGNRTRGLKRHKIGWCYLPIEIRMPDEWLRPDRTKRSTQSIAVWSAVNSQILALSTFSVSVAVSVIKRAMRDRSPACRVLSATSRARASFCLVNAPRAPGWRAFVPLRSSPGCDSALRSTRGPGSDVRPSR